MSAWLFGLFYHSCMGFCFDVLIIQEGGVLLQEEEHFIFAACGSKYEIKNFSGTPRTPAKDCVLCTPIGNPQGVSVHFDSEM
jgi:hypothetical protein